MAPHATSAASTLPGRGHKCGHTCIYAVSPKENLNLPRRLGLHEVHRKDECEREFARRHPTANAANLMSEGETSPAAQWSTPAAVLTCGVPSPSSAQGRSGTPGAEPLFSSRLVPAPSPRNFLAREVVSSSPTIISAAPDAHWKQARVSYLLSRRRVRAVSSFLARCVKELRSHTPFPKKKGC